MRGIFVPLLYLLLASLLGLSAIAHADEGLTGAEISAATAMAAGHHDGDRDQVPADADKGYPHHHGTCHGDQIGLPMMSRVIMLTTDDHSGRVFPAQLACAGLGSDPALRPPQA